MPDLLDSVRLPVLVAGLTLLGLQAGVYFVFSVGVMPGLAHVDDSTFVSTLQAINVSIVNPIFLLSFVGAPLLCAIAVVTSASGSRRWVIAAAVLAIATVVITGAGNIPLNDALAAAGPVDAIGDLSAVRTAFEAPWVRLNLLRTATSAAALLALAIAAARA